MSKMSQSDKDIVILACTVRGGIKCLRTSDRACGYTIRPELWFNVMNGGSSRALIVKGIPVKNKYSNVDEIKSILNIIEGFEELSPSYDGLMEVKKYNGVIKQPKTHREVTELLRLLSE